MLELHRIIATTAALTLGHLALLSSSTVFASVANNISNIQSGVAMSAQQLAAAPLHELRTQLTPHGWGVDRDTAGNLLLYPDATPSASAESTFARLETNDLNNVSDTDSVPQQSQNQNAQLQTETHQVASDTTKNRSPSSTAITTPKQIETVSLDADQPQNNLTRKFSNEGFGLTEVEQWRASLQPHGWGVETDTAGNLLLYPGGAEPATYAKTDKVKPNKAKTDTVKLNQGKLDMATLEAIKPAKRMISGCGLEAVNQLRAALAPHGWRVETDSRGVLLFPQAS